MPHALFNNTVFCIIYIKLMHVCSGFFVVVEGFVAFMNRVNITFSSELISIGD